MRKENAARTSAAQQCLPDGSLDDARSVDPLDSRLACPTCGDSITTSIAPRAERLGANSMSRRFRCQSCAVDFPAATCDSAFIPWMFPNPELAHLEWSARFRGFLQSASREHNRLNRSLHDTRLSESGQRRIAGLLRAKRQHRRQVSELLQPFGLHADDLVPAMTQLLEDSLPRKQGLLSYAENVFRDWTWDNGENDAMLSGIEGLLSADSRDSLGSVLTLGAGAGRLAYDVHRRYSPTVSVLLDLNPLLLSIGARIIQGQSVSLFEFPIAPLDEDSGAVLQQCRAPEAVAHTGSANFRFVLGDATSPPFADNSFDTVITPWLVDILPHDLREFLPHINRLLPLGGLWTNTGTLAFFNEDPCCQYSEKEVLELVDSSGFDIVGIDHRTIPYLQSPHSGHGRTERIVSFSARKCKDVLPVTTADTMPEWIVDTSKCVPRSPETAVASSSHLLTAQVLAAIDGKRSINAITKLVSHEYNLALDECSLAVRRIVLDIGT